LANYDGARTNQQDLMNVVATWHSDDLLKNCLVENYP
jgi:hypothetical protein